MVRSCENLLKGYEKRKEIKSLENEIRKTKKNQHLSANKRKKLNQQIQKYNELVNALNQEYSGIISINKITKFLTTMQGAVQSLAEILGTVQSLKGQIDLSFGPEPSEGLDNRIEVTNITDRPPPLAENGNLFFNQTVATQSNNEQEEREKKNYSW